MVLQVTNESPQEGLLLNMGSANDKHGVFAKISEFFLREGSRFLDKRRLIKNYTLNEFVLFYITHVVSPTGGPSSDVSDRFKLGTGRWARLALWLIWAEVILGITSKHGGCTKSHHSAANFSSFSASQEFNHVLLDFRTQLQTLVQLIFIN